MIALIPTECFYNSNWVEYHRNHYCIIKDSKSISLLLGDSIVAGVSRYSNAWNQYLAPINALDLGNGGDRVENVIWRAFDLPLQPSMKNLGILCRTNNIPIDTPGDIVDCIIIIGSIFRKKYNGINVSVCVLVLVTSVGR